MIAGCRPGAPAAPAAGQRLFTDGLGREVALPERLERIVALAPSATETLFIIGAGSQVVGCDDHSDFPQATRDLPHVGTSGKGLNRELVVALRPDLILAAQINSPEEILSLERLGLPVFRLTNPTSFEELYEMVRLVGRLTGQEANAAEAAAGLRKRVDAVGARMAGLTRRPRVFYELDGTDPSRPWTVGKNTFMHMLITLAGGENVGAEYPGSFPRSGSESLVKLDPEIVLLGDSKFGVTMESVKQRAGWSGMTAIKEGRIYTFDDDLASRPGPRLVEGLEKLAQLLHPERWQG